MSNSSTAAPQHDLTERLAEVCTRAKNFTNAGGVAIALTAGEEFITRATCGTSLQINASVPLPSNFAGFRREKGNVLRYGDTDKEATLDNAACRAARIKSMLLVPIGDLSSVRGVLAVFSSGVNAFSETHVAVLKTLAEVITHLLPEKEKPGEALPEKKTDELLEHPFNPAFDDMPKNVQVGASPQAEVSDVTNPSPPVPPTPAASPFISARAPSPVDSSPVVPLADASAGFEPGNRLRADSHKPAPSAPVRKSPTPPPLPKATPAPAYSSGRAVQSDILDLASNPLARAAPRRSRPGRSIRSAFQSTGSAASSGSRRTTYAAVAAVIAAIVFSLVLYSHVIARNAPTPEVETMPVPPSRVEKVAAPVSQTPAADHIPPVKSDVVSTATAASLPKTAIAPAAKNPVAKNIDLRASNEVRATKPPQATVSQLIVIDSPSPPASGNLPKAQEESPPEVRVAGGSSAIGDVLKPSATAPAPAFKSSQVVPSELISKVAPIYPENAKRFGIRGTVVISAKVTKTGSVSEARAVSGPAMLYEAAIAAARKWRYKPSLADGKPIESNVEIVFRFTPSQ